MSSKYWKHFSKSETKKETATCNICSAVISIHGSSTTGLKRHLISKHPEVNINESNENITSNLNVYLYTSPEVLISQLICLDNISINSLTNSLALKHMFKRINFDLPKSQETILKTLCDLYNTRKEKIVGVIKKKIEQNLKVGLSLDEWTSISNRKYLNINVNFGDKTFLCLGLIRLNNSATSEYLYRVITERLFEFGIVFCDSVFYITTDGASVMQKLAAISNVLHLKCINHAIHLAVLDFFESECVSIQYKNVSDEFSICSSETEEYTQLNTISHISINSAIQKVRKIVKVFRRSTLKNEILQKYIKQDFGTEAVLHYDCKTRWNSTHKMLNIFLKYIVQVKKAMLDLNIEFELSLSEIHDIESYCATLNPLSDVVLVLSKKENNILATEKIIKMLYYELNMINNKFSKKMSGFILQRYNERRNKRLVSILEFFNERTSIESKDALFPLNNRLEIVSDILEIGSRYFRENFIGCEITIDESDKQDVDNTNLSFLTRINSTSVYFENIIQYGTRRSTDVLKDAVDDYIITGKLISPLSDMIKQLASMRSTSVDSERIFSIAGNVLTKSRNRMSDNTLDMIVFMKHNLKND